MELAQRKEITKDAVLISFEYDEATKIVNNWLRDDSFLKSYPDEKIFKFHDGSLEEQKQLTKQLNLYKNGVVEIFCGHGSKDSLLGPPRNTLEEHSNFYTTEMVSDLPSSLFAFCCYSGEFFGLFYSCKGENKKFMGFTEKLEVLPSINNELKSIFQKVATSIIEDGEIKDKHEVMFKDLVTRLMNDIENEKIKCDTPLMILINLHKYKQCIRSFK